MIHPTANSTAMDTVLPLFLLAESEDIYGKRKESNTTQTSIKESKKRADVKSSLENSKFTPIRKKNCPLQRGSQVPTNHENDAFSD
jgi:hypothetical protein